MKKLPLILMILCALLLTACAEVERIDAVHPADVAKLSPTEEVYLTPSVLPGVYLREEAPTEIQFTWDNPAYTLRYTTDFSTPNAASKEAENGVIPLSYAGTGLQDMAQATIRCALYDGDQMVREEYGSYTFIYVKTKMTLTMPIYMVVSDHDNFYGYEKGIMVPGKLADDVKKYGNPEGWKARGSDANYFRHGPEWERASYLSVFSPDGDLMLGQNCGVRLTGHARRASSVKSLKLFARREYTPDSGVFEFPFWGDQYRSLSSGTPVAWSDDFILRSGATGFRNEFGLLMLEGTDLARPQQQFVHEFVNGVYQGVFTVLEDHDTDFITHHYGFAAEDVSLISGQTYECFLDAGWVHDDGPVEVYDEFVKLLNDAQTTDMTIQANYEALSDKVDMVNYIQHFVWRSWCGDTDWNENSNQRAWRYHAEGYHPERTDESDGRWRFLPKDMDISFGNNGQRNIDYNDPFVYVDTFHYFVSFPYFYHSCKYNAEFADLLHNRMLTMGQDIFIPERYEPVMATLALYAGAGVPGSTKNYLSTMDGIANWLSTRHEKMVGYVENHSGKKVTDITVSWDGEGEVELVWFAYQNGATRQYLNDSLVPFEAIPQKGWKVGEMELVNCEFTEKGYLHITAENPTVKVHFEKEEIIPEVGGIVINEVKFRNTDIDWIELYNTSEEPITMDGWMIGKDPSPVTAFPFGNTEIAPGAFGLICLTNYANTAGIAGLQAPISLTNGDTLYLFDHAGKIVDEILCETPSKMIHMGRLPDGGEWIQMAHDEATPAEANAIVDPGLFFDDTGFDPILMLQNTRVALENFYEEDGVWYFDNTSRARRDFRSNFPEIEQQLKDLGETDPTFDELVEMFRALDTCIVRAARELPACYIAKK